MIFSNLKNIVVAIATLVSIGNGTTAFVPEDTRVRIGAGRSIISIPSESLSFALHYQKPPKETQKNSPRMSEADFRLDYVQGVRPPLKVVVKVEDNVPLKKDDDFVYGKDSTCYRGLTKPTQAGLVLALVLASSLVVASPDIHLPSVASLVEGSRHLMGDDAASELSALVERVAFQWDMSGVEIYIHDVSDQVAVSFNNNEFLPSSLQLRDNFHEVSTTISARMDVFLAETASRIDLMKYEFTNHMAPTEAMINQALVNGKELFSQRSNEWQLSSQHNIDQLNQYVAQASNSIQGEISEALSKRRDLFATSFASLPDASQLKIDQLDFNFVPESSELRTQAMEGLTRSKDAIVSKTMEYQQVGQMGMNEIKTEMLQTNVQLHGLVNQYTENTKEFLVQKYSALNVEDFQQRAQREAFKFEEMVHSFIAPKYVELQHLSQEKLNEIGQHAIRESEIMQRRLVELGTDFEMKGKDASKDFVSFLQDSGRFLQQQMLAFRDSSFDAISKMKDQIVHSGASMANVEETLGEWKDSVTKTWSTAGNSISNQLAIDNTLQNLKETTKSMTDQISIQDSIHNFKDGTASLANQVAVQDTLQDLKESAKSISTQVSIDTNTLQDLKDNTATALSNAGNTVTNQVGTIIRQPNPVPTESSFLKSILDDVVY